MVSVSEDFRLHNGHQAVSLADGSVPSESPSILLDGLFRWASICDLKHGSPLGKSAAQGVVFCSHFGEGVKSHSGGFSVSVLGKDLHTLVNLDPWDDSSFNQQLNEVLSILGGLSALFGEENDTTDVLFEVGGG